MRRGNLCALCHSLGGASHTCFNDGNSHKCDRSMIHGVYFVDWKLAAPDGHPLRGRKFEENLSFSKWVIDNTWKTALIDPCRIDWVPFTHARFRQLSVLLLTIEYFRYLAVEVKCAQSVKCIQKLSTAAAAACLRDPISQARFGYFQSHKLMVHCQSFSL